MSKIASISFGNGAPKRDPKDVFAALVKKGHTAVLEHVPDIRNFGIYALPGSSLRQRIERFGMRDAEDLKWADGWFHTHSVEYGQKVCPASTFLVEVPLYTRSQWHRHRSQAYNEMSRRWTKDSKVGFTFYGEQWLNEDGTHVDPERLNFWATCLREYQRRLDRGEPQETARGCVPMEAHTRFWTSAFDRDWAGYLKLRAYSHAQAEIRVPATWIQRHIADKHNSAPLDAGNLGT